MLYMASEEGWQKGSDGKKYQDLFINYDKTEVALLSSAIIVSILNGKSIPGIEEIGEDPGFNTSFKEAIESAIS